MDNILPKRTARYVGPVWDSSRWDNFKGRDDDIFICTPAKAGTTWMQTICALLLFGWRDFDIKPSDVSLWYDATFRTAEEMDELVEGQSHRRFLKTHTPLDGIPYCPKSTYITVYRDPRDVFFSLRNHALNMRAGELDEVLTLDIEEQFRDWIEIAAGEDERENFSLEAIVNHYQSYRRFGHFENVHFFHYSDMKRSLPAAIAGVADAIGVDVDEQDIEQISRLADFENMRGNAEQFAPGVTLKLWKSNQNFFNKGRNGQWRDVVGEADIARYENRIRSMLTADEVAWIHDGSGR